MNEPIPYDIDELRSLIQSLADVNIVIVDKLSGDVIVYDLEGYVSKEYPTHIWPKNADCYETATEKLTRAYYNYYMALCTVIQNRIFKNENND